MPDKCGDMPDDRVTFSCGSSLFIYPMETSHEVVGNASSGVTFILAFTIGASTHSISILKVFPKESPLFFWHGPKGLPRPLRLISQYWYTFGHFLYIPPKYSIQYCVRVHSK
jgi:hypothetical protein